MRPNGLCSHSGYLTRARHPVCTTPTMTLSMFNFWFAQALGIAFLVTVAMLGVGLVVLGGASLVRLRHA